MTISISAVGDISLGDHPVRAGYGMRQALAARGIRLISDVLGSLEGSDVTMGNLETVTSNHGFRRYYLPSYEMRGDPESLDILKRAGFNLLGIANNHALQHGIPAYCDTQSQLRCRNIAVIGHDRNGQTQTYEYVKDDTTATFFAISVRPEQWSDSEVPYSYRPNIDNLLQEVSELRTQVDGFLICSIHWGLEFLNNPTPTQVYLGHALIDAGVDVIFGHHPHVLQPIERYQTGLIFYSLGNFLFDSWPQDMRHSIIAHVTLEKDRHPSYSIVPTYIDDDLSLRAASLEQQKYIDEVLYRQVTKIDNAAERAAEDKISETLYQAKRTQFRYTSYRYLLRNFLNSPPHFSFQQITRTILRRLTGN